MPLDPNIVLRGLPPPTPLQSPFEALQLVEQLRDRREQGEARRAALEERRQAGEERRQKAADEAAARQRAAAVEQRVQGALIPHPVTGRPTLDWAKLLEGGEVPSAVLFKLGEETDQAATRLVELESANLDLGKKKTLMLGTLAQPVATAGFAKPAWDAALLAAFNKKLITAEERDAGYAITDPAAIQKATTDALMQAGLTPKPSELQKITTVDAEGREVTQFVTPTEGATYPTAPPKAANAPAVGSFEDYVVRRYGPTPTFAQITQARKDYQQADDRPRITVNTGTEQDRDALMDAVIANPGLWDQITPTERGKIAGKLNARGFTGFGKPLSDGAIKLISESEAAVASLKDLREVVKRNEQYIGPIAGLQALNPYSEARKAQADIDRVRQRVGKTLEGGVLRKEDEEKYKKQLAAITDEPSTALYKIDRIAQDIARDIETYKHNQRLAGRRVPQQDTKQNDPMGIR